MNLEEEFDIIRLRRKADQAWDMSGLARMDGDTADEKRYTEEAKAIQRRISELMI